VADYIFAWTSAHLQWDVRRIRSTKSANDACFFDELAAAVQFPYYFGHNWDAVWDCITDLNWLHGSSFVFIFDEAEYLLSESDRGFRVLLEILADAHDRWHRETADFGPKGRQPIAFQSVFACDPSAVDALSQRLSAAGATFTLL
jgi:RNAse (barnase) inhibitor barstar